MHAKEQGSPVDAICIYVLAENNDTRLAACVLPVWIEQLKAAEEYQI